MKRKIRDMVIGEVIDECAKHTEEGAECCQKCKYIGNACLAIDYYDNTDPDCVALFNKKFEMDDLLTKEDIEEFKEMRNTLIDFNSFVSEIDLSSFCNTVITGLVAIKVLQRMGLVEVYNNSLDILNKHGFNIVELQMVLNKALKGDKNEREIKKPNDGGSD